MALDHSFPVLAHPFASPARGSCAYELGDTASKNALIFVAGLGDGPHTSPVPQTMARHLDNASTLSYSVFEFRMRSSYIGFGTSSLQNDVEDISALVKHLRSLGKEKIVLLGHSTGCQDCMEYVNYAKHGNTLVDGFVLLSPVSDRECMDVFFPAHEESVQHAEKMIAEGRELDCLPNDKIPTFLAAPMSAYRLRSLCVKGADDDYFSSDLDENAVAGYWARFDKPVLVLLPEEDEFVPVHIDKEQVVEKYRGLNSHVSPLSGLVPDAGHMVEEAAPQEWLANRVKEFLETF